MQPVVLFALLGGRGARIQEPHELPAAPCQVFVAQFAHQVGDLGPKVKIGAFQLI